MKNIYINPLFYILSLIMLVTGYFKPFLFMLLYLIFHESGHIIVGYILGFKVIKINIYPCGLLTTFNMKINDSIIKDLLVALSGPLFQIILYLLIKKYYNIHLFLLIFNLLPIYPLDGSKIVSDILYILFPYKMSNNILFYISYILCLFILSFFIFNFNLFYLIIFIVLFIKVISFYINLNYLFNLFILERIMYKFNFKILKKINNINHMYKGRIHTINNIKEKEYLINIYKQKRD